jgi:hypothetical protein
MAARWSRLAARRRHKPIATKLKTWEAAAAHRKCSGATSRHEEAVEEAGHVRRLGGHGSPEKGKEMAVQALRAELVGVCGLGGAQERGELDGAVVLAGGSSMAATVSGGAERRR